jgi:hypothetical protein
MTTAMIPYRPMQDEYISLLSITQNPNHRLRLLEKINDIEYETHMRNELERSFFFISYYWSALGIPVGFFISDLLFLIGLKSVPTIGLSLTTTVAAGASNILFDGINGIFSGATSTYSYFTGKNSQAYQFEKYNLQTVADNTVGSVSNIIDTIVPLRTRLSITCGLILLCIYLHYIAIDILNNRRFVAKTQKYKS